MARRDLANAALCLLRMGDTHRLQGAWEPALELYREAENIARQAHDKTQLTRALMRQASAENAMSDHSTALTHIDQAIPLAEAFPDKGFLFDAYDIKAQIQIAQGMFAGAADSLNRAFTVAKLVKDESILFYGYFHRADVYFQLAERCDPVKNVDICMQQLDLARQDYRQARTIAQTLGGQDW
jgi:tetratricopeptide (TPR) repeat protein